MKNNLKLALLVIAALSFFKSYAISKDTLYAHYIKALVNVETDRAKGIGVFVEKNIILINHELIDNARNGKVKVFGQKEEFTILGTVATDKSNDLALIKINFVSDTYFQIAELLPAKDSKIFLFANYDNGKADFTADKVKAIKAKETVTPILVVTTQSYNYAGGYPVIDTNGVLVGLTSSNEGLEKGITMATPGKTIHSLFNKRNSFLSKLGSSTETINFLMEKKTLSTCDVFSNSSNDKIMLMNGKELDVVIMEVTPDAVFYSKLNDPKNKIRSISKVHIFSMLDNKKETVFYQLDTSSGNNFTINQMRCYVRGVKDARKNYKPVLITIGGVLIGASAPLLINTLWISVSVPIIYAVVMSLHNPKIKNEVDPDVLKNPYYKQAYSNHSKNKKLKNALLYGMSTYTISLILTQLGLISF